MCAFTSASRGTCCIAECCELTQRVDISWSGSLNRKFSTIGTFGANCFDPDFGRKNTLAFWSEGCYRFCNTMNQVCLF